MDKLFLVKNIEDDYDNGTILSICSSEEAAERMAEIVKQNFLKLNHEEEIDFIVVEEMELRDDVEILWDLFPNDKTGGFTYA